MSPIANSSDILIATLSVLGAQLIEVPRLQEDTEINEIYVRDPIARLLTTNTSGILQTTYVTSERFPEKTALIQQTIERNAHLLTSRPSSECTDLNNLELSESRLTGVPETSPIKNKIVSIKTIDTLLDGGNIICSPYYNTIFVGEQNGSHDEVVLERLRNISAGFEIVPLVIKDFHLDLCMSDPLPNGTVIINVNKFNNESLEKIYNIIPKEKRILLNETAESGVWQIKQKTTTIRKNIINEYFQVFDPWTHSMTNFVRIGNTLVGSGFSQEVCKLLNNSGYNILDLPLIKHVPELKEKVINYAIQHGISDYSILDCCDPDEALSFYQFPPLRQFSGILNGGGSRCMTLENTIESIVIAQQERI